MKKTILTLSLASLVLVACSKPTHDAAQDVQTTPQTEAAAASTPAAESEHTAENGLNWAGEYKGLLPCADCEGIETKLELKPDNHYVITEEYKGGKGEGNPIKTEGTFTFDANTSIVTLDKQAEERKFFVGENFLEARERETGAKIEGALAEQYKLTKEAH